MKKTILIIAAALTTLFSCTKQKNIAPGTTQLTPTTYNVLYTDSIVGITRVLAFPEYYEYSTYRIDRVPYTFSNKASADSFIKAVYHPLNLNDIYSLDGRYVTYYIYARYY
jgi:hypothetical protein